MAGFTTVRDLGTEGESVASFFSFLFVPFFSSLTDRFVWPVFVVYVSRCIGRRRSPPRLALPTALALARSKDVHFDASDRLDGVVWSEDAKVVSLDDSEETA
jgi:hypothetical protein